MHINDVRSGFKLFCLCLLIFCFANVANAHSPYIDPIQKVEGPNGESLLLESLCGDGVVTCDPISIQLVNQHNDVLAFTESDKLTATFCPSLRFCWVFPYDSYTVTPLRLDYKNLDYKSKKQNSQSTKQKEFFKDQIKFQGFVLGPSWIKVLSPLIIIGDNLILFSWVAFITFILGLLFPLYFRRVFKLASLMRVLGLFFGALLVIACLGLGFFFTLACLITWSEPPVYLLLFAGIGLLVGIYAFWLLIKKSKEKVAA